MQKTINLPSLPPALCVPYVRTCSALGTIPVFSNIQPLWAVWFLAFSVPQISSSLKVPLLVFQHDYGFLFCHSEGLEEQETEHVLIWLLKPEALHRFPSFKILGKLFIMSQFQFHVKKKTSLF